MRIAKQQRPNPDLLSNGRDCGEQGPAFIHSIAKYEMIWRPQRIIPQLLAQHGVRLDQTVVKSSVEGTCLVPGSQADPEFETSQLVTPLESTKLRENMIGEQFHPFI